MSEAYRVKRFHHVTPAKHKRLLDSELIPLIDRFANVRILQENIDDIMSTEDALKLSVDDFDKHESQILTIQNLMSGDWLIEYTDKNHPIYLYKIKRYCYQPHVHLYIKHFAELEHYFKIKPSAIPDEALERIIAAGHLTTLPLSISKMLEKYEALVHARNEKRRMQEVEDEQEAKDKAKKRRSSYEILPITRREKQKNGPVIVIRANPNAKEAIAKYRAFEAQSRLTIAQKKQLRKKKLRRAKKQI